MSSTTDTASAAAETDTSLSPDLRLEVVVIPVADVERSKGFYQGMGWRLDADFAFNNGFRVVEFTPPGSPAAIQFGTRITTAAPGSARGLYLVVPDVQAAREALARRGVEISDVFHPGAPGAQFAENGERLSGPAPGHETYSSFATFSDPDGNEWLLQEVTQRLPGRIEATRISYASIADLAAAMRRASTAHGAHEARAGGAYDAGWPDWYAAYMVAEQAGSELPT